MSLESDIALIKRIPLFADLPTEQLRLLAFSSTRIPLESGQVLFKEGDVATTGYVVSEGGLEVTHASARSRPPIQCEPGSLIGEIALFTETVRPATARAVMDSSVLEIDRKLIQRMLTEYPHLALRLRAKLAERLRATIDDLASVRRSLEKPGG